MRTIEQGDEVPPPIKSFRDMKLPEPMLSALEAKGIKRPTPIQVKPGGWGSGTVLFADYLSGACVRAFFRHRVFGFATAVG